MTCLPDEPHEGAVLPTGIMLDVIDNGFVIEVRCETCKQYGRAVIDITADVEWSEQ